jgi:uncharacterized paraquat-inducible protein A
MRRNIDVDDDDDWDAENWDDFEPDEPEDEDDDDETIPCPHCGQPVYEDAERCPHCERYLSQEDAPAGRKPVWIIIGAVAVMTVVYIWITYNQ